MNKIPEKNYIHPSIKIKKSTVSGQGLFAVAPIKKGTLVISWGGGIIVTNEEFKKGFAQGLYQPESAIHFDENHKWTTLASDPNPEDIAINHSCDANLWFENGWPLVARRNISAGEEITFNYSTGETYPLNSECRCGAKNCRKQITGKEWKDPEFQKKYKGHFNPYIQGLINKQRQTKNVYHLPIDINKVTATQKDSIAHTGDLVHSIDYDAPEGSLVYAALAGVVISVKDDSNKGGLDKKFEKDGNYIEILHKHDEVSEYEHLRQHSVRVKVGDQVATGDIIAEVGNTGWSECPHLHFMVYLKNQPYKTMEINFE